MASNPISIGFSTSVKHVDISYGGNESELNPPCGSPPPSALFGPLGAKEVCHETRMEAALGLDASHRCARLLLLWRPLAEQLLQSGSQCPCGRRTDAAPGNDAVGHGAFSEARKDACLLFTSD